MRQVWRFVVAALPGAALALAALAGFAPAHRDLPDYFVPLRARTALVVAGERGPFWDPNVGCGEPYLANPQTGVLYPPAWLAVLVPPARAVWLEAGLHVGVLAVGTLLLAGRLGARPWMAVAAGWGAALAGPTLDAAGVLNNLDTLAWLPWMWWAAAGGAWRRLALFAALAWLAAEPQLALVGAAVALALAPARRTVAGLLLGVGLVAAQALPFAAWVRGGDRGSGQPVAEVVAGAVGVDDLAALALPGAPLAPRPDRFVAHPTVPLWVLALGAVALASGGRAGRVLAGCGWALLAASVLAGVHGPDAGWAALTGGLVRFPGRLVFPAVVALAAAGAAAVRRRAGWIGAVVLAVGIACALAARAAVGESAAQALAAAAVLAGPAAPAAALAGSAALLVRAADVAGLPSMSRPAAALCLAAQRGAGGRVYAVEPSREQLRWAGDDAARRAALGLGYAALLDGRVMARTFAPLQSSALAAHLAAADRGPGGRWWLDSVGARRLVAQHPVAGFDAVCRDGDLVVADNPAAWPEALVAREVPEPDRAPVPAGEATPTLVRDDQRAWRVRVDGGGGVLLWLATPDPGWRFRVDRRTASTVAGPGIVHGLRVPAGGHEVTASYRPPGLVAGLAITGVSALVLLGSAWRRS